MYVSGAAGDDLPKLLVVYATGAAAPTEIVDAAAGLATVTFACATTDPEVRAIGRLLSTVAGCEWYTTRQELGTMAGRFDAVVTFAESRLPDLAAAVEASGLPGPDSDLVARLTRKPSQRAALAAAGLPVPQWRTATSGTGLLDAWTDLGRVPCVVKPVVGMASTNTFAVDDAVDLTDVSLPAGEYIVEERLVGAPTPHRRVGDYLSVETVSSRGRHEAFAVMARMPLVAPYRESGFFFPAPLDDQQRDEVVRAALRALTACGVCDGVSHVEIKLTAMGPRIIEVNGRLGGHVAHLVKQTWGGDAVRDAILCALGRAPASGVPDGDADTVFRWFGYAEQTHGTLSSVQGIDAVRALPGVTGVKRLLRKGDAISWTRGTSGAVVQVDGRVDDLDALDRLLDQVDQNLVIETEAATEVAR